MGGLHDRKILQLKAKDGTQGRCGHSGRTVHSVFNTARSMWAYKAPEWGRKQGSAKEIQSFFDAGCEGNRCDGEGAWRTPNFLSNFILEALIKSGPDKSTLGERRVILAPSSRLQFIITSGFQGQNLDQQLHSQGHGENDTHACMLGSISSLSPDKDATTFRLGLQASFNTRKKAQFTKATMIWMASH